MRFADRARQVRLVAWLLHDFVLRFQVRLLPIDMEIAGRWIVLMAGQVQRPLPEVDGLLAATAQHSNVTFMTRNIVDVAGTGVPTFNPWL
jgi:toxin FitB